MNIELKDIKPGEGLGTIKFGMTRDQVKEILGEADVVESYSYTDSDQDLTESWDYKELSLSLNFDEEDDWRLIVISVTSDFYQLEGETLIGQSEEKLKEVLAKVGMDDLEMEDWSSAESPDHKLIESNSHSVNFWINEGRLDEIQWSPQFIDDDTIKWPEL
ncbi:hypothetical protein LVD15_06530 [Fulvivirga maritima]|uniref:hypothetical protein n=1 Tax=Fulvivirga maritima TaxID=2904247 RepID=UPI001F1BFBAE|nr:hypothetical protein [Fulvivirga maritima]UII28078.1 hypothetical protein LVD15_06530 [Fulvivirga maritima]